MLLLENLCGKALRGVIVEHRNRTLHHDRAVVHRLIHKMDSASGNFGAVLQRLGLCIEPWKSRQQRWVNVQDPVGKCAHELRREDPHISRQADQVHAVLVQASDHLGIVFRALASRRRNGKRSQPHLARGGQSGGVGLVGQYHRDLRAQQAALANRTGDGDEVRTSA